ncbi:MAG: hypothetical protein ACJAW8_000616 [Oleispira sp.]|jgi:hypothetical protein
MKIEPYNKVDDVSLDIRDSELLNHLGDPERQSTNSVGLLEFDFGSRVFRFDSTGTLNEVTIESEVIEVEGVAIPFKYLASHINAEDAGAFVKYGFIVSPAFGVAFDPEHSPWVTVLTKTGLAAWEKV